ncbi:MAG: hypothetical protein JST30_10325 [Armatimonadetes bacterium]|nr:hypothetical protein [Armatimonadota bacterium]
MTFVWAQAIQASVPVPGDSMPHYFSGTKARASGKVWRDENPEQIVEAWLYLNGELVHHWVHPNQGQYVPEIVLEIMFDSTHFANGSIVEVKMKGKNQWGDIAQDINFVEVKNRCVGFGRHDFLQYNGGDGVTELVTQLTGHNYGFLTTTSYGWACLDITDSMSNPGIYYVATHGNSAAHQTNNLIPVIERMYALPVSGEQDYQNVRTLRNGSGYPPLNSTDNPYVAFALMDFCNSGSASDFQTVLYPYYDAYSADIVDQAMIGWGDVVYLREAENRVSWLFRFLVVGKTVQISRDTFLTLNSETADPVHVGSTSHLASTSSDCPIFGDEYTRIKRVYTHTHYLITPGQWYRPL